MTDGGSTGGPPADPINRKAGWYRDRKTGQRRFWNGVAWSELSDAITPFSVEPTHPTAPTTETGQTPPPGLRKRLARRPELIGSVVAVVVLVAATLLGISLYKWGNAPVSTTAATVPPSLPSDADFPTLPSETTTSPFDTTTTSSSVSTSPGGGAAGSPTTTVTGPGATTPPVSISEPPNPDRNVAIVGDSITVLVASDLAHVLHGYQLIFDAKSSTTMAEHLQNIEQIASDGQPRDWVIELGTNDAFPTRANPHWASDFANEVGALQTQRCVVFLTVNPRFGSVATGLNGAIASAVATHANFHSLDWGDIEFRKPEWLASDGIHPSKSGIVELTKLEHKAIHDCQAD